MVLVIYSSVSFHSFNNPWDDKTRVLYQSGVIYVVNGLPNLQKGIKNRGSLRKEESLFFEFFSSPAPEKF